MKIDRTRPTRTVSLLLLTSHRIDRSPCRSLRISAITRSILSCPIRGGSSKGETTEIQPSFIRAVAMEMKGGGQSLRGLDICRSFNCHRPIHRSIWTLIYVTNVLSICKRLTSGDPHVDLLWAKWRTIKICIVLKFSDNVDCDSTRCGGSEEMLAIPFRISQ